MPRNLRINHSPEALSKVPEFFFEHELFAKISATNKNQNLKEQLELVEYLQIRYEAVLIALISKLLEQARIEVLTAQQRRLQQTIINQLMVNAYYMAAQLKHANRHYLDSPSKVKRFAADMAILAQSYHLVISDLDDSPRVQAASSDANHSYPVTLQIPKYSRANYNGVRILPVCTRLVEFFGESNWWRLFVARLEGLLLAFDSAVPTHSNYYRLTNNLSATNIVFSYLGWIWMLPQLLINTGVIIKHAWNNRHLPWAQQKLLFQAHWDKRKTAIVSDCAWVMVGLISCFVLSPAGGLFLSVAVYIADILYAHVQATRELEKYTKVLADVDSEIHALEQEVGKIKQLTKKLKALTSELTLIRERISALEAEKLQLTANGQAINSAPKLAIQLRAINAEIEQAQELEDQVMVAFKETKHDLRLSHNLQELESRIATLNTTRQGLQKNIDFQTRKLEASEKIAIALLIGLLLCLPVPGAPLVLPMIGMSIVMLACFAHLAYNKYWLEKQAPQASLPDISITSKSTTTASLKSDARAYSLGSKKNWQ